MPLRKKQNKSLEQLSACQGAGFLFLDENADKKAIKHANTSLSIFMRIGMKESKFNNCSFTQSEFRDCYLRKCTFDLVDFTGSTFFDCNLEKAKFTRCDLKYARFFNCNVDYEGIIGSLPVEPNLRLLLARNLRSNALQLGDKEMADSFLEVAMEAEETLQMSIIRGDTLYYRQNYDMLKRLKAIFTLFNFIFQNNLGLWIQFNTLIY